MKNKKGLSQVIGTLIMITMVIVLITIVWVAVNKMTNKAVEDSESCFDIAGKANINNAYTCWRDSANPKELQFSISLGDINPGAVLVSVSTISTKKSYTINSDGTSTYTSVANYAISPSYGGELTGLTANSGQTYITRDFEIVKPDSVELFLIFGEKQCSASDVLYEIDDCSS